MVPRDKMGFESLGVHRQTHLNMHTHACTKLKHIYAVTYTHVKKNKTLTSTPDLYLVHTSWCTHPHIHANTQCTLIRLKAFQPHGDVTAQQ